MMGNFLTTLGSEPEDDRAMFEELGLNTARQADNGANPRPGQPPGWLGGEISPTPIDRLVDRRAEALLWIPPHSFDTEGRARCPRGRMGASNRGAPRMPEVAGGAGRDGDLATRGGDG